MGETFSETESHEVCAAELVDIEFPEEQLSSGGALSLQEIRRRCGYAPLVQCTICIHPRRKEMEQAIMTEAHRKVAERYGVGPDALLRHMQNHFVIPT